MIVPPSCNACGLGSNWIRCYDVWNPNNTDPKDAVLGLMTFHTPAADKVVCQKKPHWPFPSSGSSSIKWKQNLIYGWVRIKYLGTIWNQQSTPWILDIYTQGNNPVIWDYKFVLVLSLVKLGLMPPGGWDRAVSSGNRWYNLPQLALF